MAYIIVYVMYMVQAMININEHVNRVLNIIKAKYGLKNKSEAIEVAVHEYEEECLEPELRPEYTKKLGRIAKGKFISRAKLDKTLGE